MRITTKGRYAVRAILYLVNCGAESTISIRQLSEETCLSPEFLEQIFFRLRKAGIISSTRGPGGGFSFTKKPSEVSVDDVFVAIDEGYHVTPCSEDDTVLLDCEYHDKCIACDFWRYTYNFTRSYFAAVSIQDIIDGKFPIISQYNGDQL